MLWVKSFHIIALICWFAALFYLPRLFVYHALCADLVGQQRFCVMERKLYRGIMTPAMLATLFFGFWAASYQWTYYIGSGWFHAKLTLVALLLIYHLYCGYLYRQFAQDKNQHGDRFFRVLNELPVLILIPVVLLVVIRPF